MVTENKNAQQWLDEKYLKDGTCQRDNDPENRNKTRKEVTDLDIRKGKVGSLFSKSKNLKGSLKLEKFTNLRKLIVSSHQLIELDVSDCSNLEELECHGNELTSLNVNGCSNLRKINCSNNNLKELDLSSCSNLEVVNINNNPNLAENNVKSNLIYNAEKGKLVKDNSQVKSGPQIIKAKENDIRNILIIGITGNGKSTLANVLTSGSSANYFGEKNSSISVTKNFKESNVFEWESKKYRVIDNVGFLDTNDLKKDLLFKIGEGIHSAKEGINQVFFVFSGRFSEGQIKAFNLFKDFIDETEITKFTTLVRTNFENFQSKEECKKDQKDLLTQSSELTEIVNSCNGILYVNNPSVSISIPDDEDEEEKEERERMIDSNKKNRKESREKVLNHLVENCSEVYKLKEWDSIHQQVTNCIAKIREDEERLAKSSNDAERNGLRNEIRENRDRIAEEVNFRLGAEISALPKLTAQVEMKNPNIWPFNK